MSEEAFILKREHRQRAE